MLRLRRFLALALEHDMYGAVGGALEGGQGVVSDVLPVAQLARPVTCLELPGRVFAVAVRIRIQGDLFDSILV